MNNADKALNAAMTAAFPGLPAGLTLEEAERRMRAGLAAAYQEAANLIDRGPAIPLPPSIYSALLREQADDLTRANR